jgi:hypothetical protein
MLRSPVRVKKAHEKAGAGPLAWLLVRGGARIVGGAWSEALPLSALLGAVLRSHASQAHINFG